MNISEWIKIKKESYRKSKHERQLKLIIGRSKELYQVKEFGNSLWLVRGLDLICPMFVFKESDVVSTINELRSLYVHYTCESCGIKHDEEDVDKL